MIWGLNHLNIYSSLQRLWYCRCFTSYLVSPSIETGLNRFFPSWLVPHQLSFYFVGVTHREFAQVSGNYSSILQWSITALPLCCEFIMLIQPLDPESPKGQPPSTTIASSITPLMSYGGLFIETLVGVSYHHCCVISRSALSTPQVFLTFPLFYL